LGTVGEMGVGEGSIAMTRHETYLQVVDVDVDVDLQLCLELAPAAEPAHLVELLPVGISVDNLEDVLVRHHATGYRGRHPVRLYARLLSLRADREDGCCGASASALRECPRERRERREKKRGGGARRQTNHWAKVRLFASRFGRRLVARQEAFGNARHVTFHRTSRSSRTTDPTTIMAEETETFAFQAEINQLLSLIINVRARPHPSRAFPEYQIARPTIQPSTRHFPRRRRDPASAPWRRD